MPWVGFESTIPALERTKTVHALDRAATVIVKTKIIRTQNISFRHRLPEYVVVDNYVQYGVSNAHNMSDPGHVKPHSIANIS
jgi:hypothetical protein